MEYSFYEKLINKSKIIQQQCAPMKVDVVYQKTKSFPALSFGIF